jgi:hypothetical protein
MPMTRTRIALSFVTVAILSSFGLSLHAYTTYAKWGTSRVDFYVNPANADVGKADAQASLVAGARAWTSQSNAAFEFVFAGTVSDTATSNDGRNVVFFRNTTNGSSIASTYSWWSNGKLLDSDIIFWDGGFRFFAGSSGCGGSNAAYIEDIAAHEFGHALGLNHSTVSGATMYAGYSTCSMSQRTLAADDVAGVEALYPPTTATDAPPTISVMTPSGGASFAEGTAVSFAGTATDIEDGSISSKLAWTSSLDGQLGTGSSFERILSLGDHTITVTVTDSGGNRSEARRTFSVVAPEPAKSGFTATGRGFKVKGVQHAELTWSGTAATSIDVLRNGARVARVANTGRFSDNIGRKGGGAYTYVVCAAGTSTCSNPVTITF